MRVRYKYTRVKMSRIYLLLICVIIFTNGIVHGQDDVAPATGGDGLDTSTIDGSDVTGSDVEGPETSTIHGSDTDTVGETTVEGETPPSPEPSASDAADGATDAGDDATDAPGDGGDGATDAAGESTTDAAGDSATNAGADAVTGSPDVESTTGESKSETSEPSTDEPDTVSDGTAAAGDDVTVTTAATESVAPTAGTTDSTVSPVDVKFVPDEEMTQQQRDNSLTLELDLTNANIDWDNPEEVAAFYTWLQEVIASLLDQAEQRRRKREIHRTIKKIYKPDDVKFAGKHQIKNGKLILSVFVKKPGSTVAKPPAIPKEKLEAIKDKLAEKMSQKNIKVTKIYTGVPAPVTGAVSHAGGDASDDDENVFDAHLGLFLVLIIVSIVCLISIIIGVILIKCRGRSGSYQTKSCIA
ncbi:uncharacterized protein LOC141902044 isoform X2 [Tubulanus polymorphus]|uniref:uncharacterized protein LOC141902044 isoform X2 n=1 Tax=Tubulanus polymorphus TaxID=672921 RepID=UPI003DA38EC9